jgi:hypothetical protein
MNNSERTIFVLTCSLVALATFIVTFALLSTVLVDANKERCTQYCATNPLNYISNATSTFLTESNTFIECVAHKIDYPTIN